MQFQRSRMIGLGIVLILAISGFVLFLSGNSGDSALSPRWTHLGGSVGDSWSSETVSKVRSLAVFQGSLIAGLSGPVFDWEAQAHDVWQYDGQTWRQIGGSGVNGSWQQPLIGRVNVLVAKEDLLYAGVGMRGPSPANAEVWVYDGVSWELIGGSGVNGSWSDGAYELTYTLAWFEDRLYAGFHADDTGKRADVWAFDPRTKQWEQVGGDNLAGGWGRGDYSGIYELYPHDDYLYAGTWGRHPGDDDVWQFDGERWRQVGGDGLRGSWDNRSIADIEGWVESITSFEGQLVVGLERYDTENPAPPVWLFDGENWQALPSGDFTASDWNRHGTWNAIIAYEDRLFVGAGGNSQRGGASLYEFHQGEWRKVGGGGLNGSWDSSQSIQQWIYRLIIYDGQVCVGLAGNAGSGQVWCYSL